jgi:hypothetical protein
MDITTDIEDNKGLMKIFFLLFVVFLLPAQAQQTKSVFTPGFVMTNAGACAASVVDVAITQHCISDKECHELDWIYRGSAARMYTTGISLCALGTFADYEMEHHGHPEGRIVPWAIITSHSIAAGFNLRF